MSVESDIANLRSLVRQLQGMLGDKSIRVGKSSVTFTAASLSAQVAVPHGLGKTPVAVFTTSATPIAGRIEIQESAAADATNVYLTGVHSLGTNISVTQNFYWLVIG